MVFSKITVYTWGMMSGILLALAYALSGLQIADYNPVYNAIGGGVPDEFLYSKIIRYGFQVPAGILSFIFFYTVERIFPYERLLQFGFKSLSYIFGVSTIISAVFPCDAGCANLTFGLSVSQGVHLMSEMLSTSLIIFMMLLLAAGYRRIGYIQLSQITNWCCFIIFASIIILYNDSTWVGLFQRVIKICYITFVISTAHTMYYCQPFNAKKVNFH